MDQLHQQQIKQQINEWYLIYSNDIYNYIFMMIRDSDQAKDILQDTFVRAYSKYDSFENKNVKRWLFRVARNITIDYIRKRKPIAYIFDSSPTMKTAGQTPEQLALLNETERELYKALGKLKRSYRDVILLRKMKDFNIKETSEILGWSKNKVKVQLFRAMKALRKEMEKEGYIHETI